MALGICCRWLWAFTVAVILALTFVLAAGHLRSTRIMFTGLLATLSVLTMFGNQHLLVRFKIMYLSNKTVWTLYLSSEIWKLKLNSTAEILSLVVFKHCIFIRTDRCNFNYSYAQFGTTGYYYYYIYRGHRCRHRAWLQILLVLHAIRFRRLR